MGKRLMSKAPLPQAGEGVKQADARITHKEMIKDNSHNCVMDITNFTQFKSSSHISRTEHLHYLSIRATLF